MDATGLSQQPHATVDKAYIQELIAAPNPNIVLIDVREPSETAQGMIPTAKHIPVGALDDAFRLDASTFKATHGFDKPTNDQDIVVYCRSGRRSGMATQTLLSHGFKVKDFSGGWISWSA
ncbi:Rhodanese-like domain-containing protein [Entophlyctis helioformis]|nr:Rhodanese-like domain-containing protein [Entophlyctis helioformis]